jgi:hypothetical protein
MQPAFERNAHLAPRFFQESDLAVDVEIIWQFLWVKGESKETLKLMLDGKLHDPLADLFDFSRTANAARIAFASQTMVDKLSIDQPDQRTLAAPFADPAALIAVLLCVVKTRWWLCPHAPGVC